ncbi:MAG: NgoFVII family restriction endonuclease [Clostridiales bacterium]|nr:NgoFVII family restriction endonuclease [Clostridiales bacterium]
MLKKLKYFNSIAKKILYNPISHGANKLCILSYNASPSMVSWLITAYKENKLSSISIELIVESAVNDGINNISHEGFKELHKNHYSDKKYSFSCSYLYEAPTSQNNLYIWLKNDVPIQAFSCIQDFTQASFLGVEEAIISEQDALSTYSLYESAVSRSIYCTHSEVEEYIVIYTHPISLKKSDESNCVHLPLITKNGKTGNHSGLNWGQRKKRNKNQAYIPVPAKIAKSGFFPLKDQHFLAVTDDHCTLLLRVEQQNDKAITTSASNAQLGEYFRGRLKLGNGAYVHSSDLISYGRTDVTFYKIDEEQYYMDFSPESKR